MPGTTSRAEIEATASRDQATYSGTVSTLTEGRNTSENKKIFKILEKDNTANRIHSSEISKE